MLGTVKYALLLAMGFGAAEQTVKTANDAAKRVAAVERDERNVSTIQAVPPGGIDAFRQYIVDNMPDMTVPRAGARMKFKFVVEKNGALSEIHVLDDGGCPAIASQAVKVIRRSPKWTPAEDNGRRIRMTYVLPITMVWQE